MRTQNSKSLSLTLRLLSIAVAWTCCALCSNAQNNPYKISDSLYPLYQQAYRMRATEEGLGLADRLWQQADNMHDGKARCLARTINVLHYYRTDDVAAFEHAVKMLQDESVRSGYMQYYYFGSTNRVNYLISHNNVYEAMLYANNIEQQARKTNNIYGLYSALNCLGTLHMHRMEETLAIKTFNEALDIGTKYLPTLDNAAIYRKLAECYGRIFRYDRMYDIAETGYKKVKVKSSRMTMLRHMAFAALKMQRYDTARECCVLYEKLNGVIRGDSRELADKEMNAIKSIVNGDYMVADSLIEAIPYKRYLEQSLLLMELYHKRGDWSHYVSLRQKYYEMCSFYMDSVRLQDLEEMSVNIANQKIEIESRSLAIDRQRALGEQRRSSIENANLSLDNARLSLHNSSLELNHTRTKADLLRLSLENKQLEADRLRGELKAKKAKSAARGVFDKMLVVAVVVVLLALAVHLYRRKVFMRRLRHANNLLKRKKRLLENARERAVSADRLKTSFIQGMGSEIREPLNAIAEYSRMISDNDGNMNQEGRSECHRQIRENTDRLLSIVGTLLEKMQQNAKMVVVAAWLAAGAIGAAAQNNPYKINDSLYRIYVKAHAQQKTLEGLSLADQMYKEAERLGDRKAQCLALTINMFYYYYNYDATKDSLAEAANYRNFRLAVKSLKDKALATGYEQYFYFGMTTEVNYLLNRGHMEKALDLVQANTEYAQKHNSKYGLFSGLNGLGLVHWVRMEHGLAIKAYRDALAVGERYLPDQDMGSVYRKLGDCYYELFDYANMIKMSQRGLAVAKTKTLRLRLLRNLAMAQFFMGDYEAFQDSYRKYVEINGEIKTYKTDNVNTDMMVMKYLADGEFQKAKALIDGIGMDYSRQRNRYYSIYYSLTGNYRKATDINSMIFRGLLDFTDSSRLGDMMGLGTKYTNMKLGIDNLTLSMERQRMENERQRMAINNSKLQLAHTQLELRNSALELRRIRTDADVMSMSVYNKKLETARLQGRLKEEHANAATRKIVALAGLLLVVMIAVAVFMVMRKRHAMLRNLSRLHSSLERNNRNLEEARRQAVSADMMKTEFINSMGERLRQPLSEIVTNASIIAKSGGNGNNEHDKASLSRLRESTDKLLDYVGEVLNNMQEKQKNTP